MTKQASIQRKVKTLKMENSKYNFLQECGYTTDTIYGEGQYEGIKKTLTDIGGEAVILLPDEYDEAIEVRGKCFIRPKIKMKLGYDNQCHFNSAKLWMKNIFKRQLYTGYALTEDGIWRQHSWVVEGLTVIETTVKRIAYYGFKLTKEEAMKFYQKIVLINLDTVDLKDINEDVIRDLKFFFEFNF